MTKLKIEYRRSRKALWLWVNDLDIGEVIQVHRLINNFLSGNHPKKFSPTLGIDCSVEIQGDGLRLKNKYSLQERTFSRQDLETIIENYKGNTCAVRNATGRHA